MINQTLNKISQININEQFFGLQGGGSFEKIEGVSDLVSLFLNGAFALAGLILLFYFIMGGIGIIASAGSDNPKGAEQAKATVTSAVIGFVVVFVSYWIVQLLGQLLGIDNFI